jgi:hypothetical protein
LTVTTPRRLMVTGSLCVLRALLLGTWASAEPYAALATSGAVVGIIQYFYRSMLTGPPCQPVYRAHRHLPLIAVPNRDRPGAPGSTVELSMPPDRNSPIKKSTRSS